MKISIKSCLLILGPLVLSSCISSRKIDSLNLSKYQSNKIVRTPADVDPKTWKIQTDLFETISNSNMIEQLKKARLNRFHLDPFGVLKVNSSPRQDLQGLDIWFKNNGNVQEPIRVENKKEYVELDYSGDSYMPRPEKDFFVFKDQNIDSWSNFANTHQKLSAEAAYKMYVDLENEYMNTALKVESRCSGYWKLGCTESLIEDYKTKRTNYANAAHLLRQKIEKEPIGNFEAIVQESDFYKNGHSIRFLKDTSTAMKMIYFRLDRSGHEYTTQLHTLIALKNLKESVICVDISEDEGSHINCSIK